MKKCPHCSRNFDDDNDYCPEDGTSLIPDSGGQPFGTFQSSGEMPTQIVNRPNATNPQLIGQPVPAGSKTSQFLIFGVILLLAVTAVGFAVAYFSSQNVREDSLAVPDAAGNTSKKSVDEKQKELDSENDRLRNTIAPDPSPDPAYSPAGKWSGDWRSTSGAHLTADIELSLSENQSVEGTIVWTLRRTVDSSKQRKVGFSATEHVRGTFDQVTRRVSLAGFRKDDPFGVLANLDRYRLTLGSDGNRMTGSSSNFGRWNAQFNLKRQ